MHSLPSKAYPSSQEVQFELVTPLHVLHLMWHRILQDLAELEKYPSRHTH